MLQETDFMIVQWPKYIKFLLMDCSKKEQKKTMKYLTAYFFVQKFNAIIICLDFDCLHLLSLEPSLLVFSLSLSMN